MSSIFKSARKKTGMSQEEAAGKLGVHPTTLNKYESGARFPSGKVLKKMSELYQISLQSLIEAAPTSNPVMEADKMTKEKLARVEKELLELYRENRLLKEQVEKHQKKERTNN